MVIEVKFVRPGVSFAKVAEEIAADAALYGAEPKWRILIPFVWDDSLRTEDHPKLIEGLRKLEMVQDAVVVPRPGKMQRNAQGAIRARKPSFRPATPDPDPSGA